MPFFAPLIMLAVTVVIAIADVTFLSDVIGQVLNLEQTESFLLSMVVGLVGLTFMAHLGYREASEHRVSVSGRWVHIVIWLALGFAIAAARLFSAKILDLGAADGADLELWSLPIRQQDAVFAPIMLLMFVIAGIGAREATKDLFLNENFHRHLGTQRQERAQLNKEKRAAEELKRKNIAAISEERDSKQREMLDKKDRAKQAKAVEAAQHAALKKEHTEALHREALKTHEKRQELERERLDREKESLGAVEEAKRSEADRAQKKRSYDNANRSYSQLRNAFDIQMKKVTELLALVESLDSEIATIDPASANRIRVINKSEESMQHKAAFLIHARSKEPVAHLRTMIENFNASRTR